MTATPTPTPTRLHAIPFGQDLNPDQQFAARGAVIQTGPVPLKSRQQDEERGDRGDQRPSKAPPAKPLPVAWFDDIEPSLEASGFVQGLLVEKSAVVIYGDSNAGKTFWTTDLALHVAAGREWNGRRVEQGCVIYCVLEGSRGFRNRVAAWKRKHHMEGARIPFAVVELPLDLLTAEADTPRLIATVNAAADHIGLPVKLVVIDTLSRALAGGNENSSEDMGALVQNTDAIRAATGACLLFIHHSGKDQAKGARGWSGLRAAVDTEIEVIATGEDGSAFAKVVKQRDLPKGASFPFRLETIVLGQDQYGDDVTSCVVEPAEPDPTGQREGPSLSPDQQAALRVLQDVVAERGEAGHAGVPPGVLAVPEDWWRERFYSRCKINASQEAKKRSFRRAVDALALKGLAAADAGRVWLP